MRGEEAYLAGKEKRGRRCERTRSRTRWGGEEGDGQAEEKERSAERW